MADEPETPETKPALRRRAPRKAADPAAERKPPARRKPAAKSTVDKIEDAAADAVSAPVAAAKKAAKAVKPRSTNRATPRAQAKGGKITPQNTPATTEKRGRSWDAAAIAGGLGAAATVEVLSLRGSTSRKKGSSVTKEAHQPDGTDSSASFDAGIADENTVPGKTPSPAAETGTAHQPDGTDSTASFDAGIADENTIPG